MPVYPLSSKLCDVESSAGGAADSEISPVPGDVKLSYIQPGYWHLPGEGEIEPELMKFINGGGPPVYIGFGSMPTPRAKHTAETIFHLANEHRHRIILSRGWSEIGDHISHDNVFVTGHTPHDKLFPLMGLVVHHGGAGTTATAARAGVPQFIIPHLADQFFWGHTLQKINVAPKPVKEPRLTDRRLAAAVDKALTDRSIKESAALLGEKLREKDSMQETMKLLGL